MVFNREDIYTGMLVLDLWPGPWKVLVLPIFIQGFKTSPVSAESENGFNHLKCLDFGAEWLYSKIHNSSH